MRIALASSAMLGLFSVGLVGAFPQGISLPRSAQAGLQEVLLARQAGVVSPDGTCGSVEDGEGIGYRCPSTMSKCCSKHGWCGDDPEHCETEQGCQVAFGICTGAATDPPTPSPSVDPETEPLTTLARPHIGSVPYGVTLTSCSVAGTVALTFDDGPYIFTQELLNLLSAKGAKATFFVNGQNWGSIYDYASEIRNARSAGHQIASHTWAHPDLNSLDANGITSQMNLLENALLQIMGGYPTYMRPPYLNCGATCLSTMNTLGYHVISTNLDTLDWQYNTPTTNWQSQQIFDNGVSSGSLVLSHDVHQTTVQLLAGHMIDTAKARGYRLVTVGECLGDPAANWYRTSL